MQYMESAMDKNKAREQSLKFMEDVGADNALDGAVQVLGGKNNSP